MEQEGGRASLLTLARAAAKALTREATSATSRADICLDLLHEDGRDERLARFRRVLHTLPVDERHYWIGTLYADGFAAG